MDAKHLAREIQALLTGLTDEQRQQLAAASGVSPYTVQACVNGHADQVPVGSLCSIVAAMGRTLELRIA